MANVQSIEGDVLIRGALRVTGTVTMGAGSIQDGAVNAAADLQYSKLQHQHRPVYRQESETTAAAEQQTIHVVVGATGTLLSVKAGCVTPCAGNATITVDLLVNGASVLDSACIELSSAEAAYELLAGSIDDTALEVGDVIEIDVAVDAGTGTLGEGLFCVVDLSEAAI